MRTSARFLGTIGLTVALSAAACGIARADEPAAVNGVATAAVVAVAAPGRQPQTVGLSGSGARSFPFPQYHLGTADAASSLPVRPILYVLQLVDSIQSAHGRRIGAVETNPMVKPFSHGGAATYALGFALGDVLRTAVFRHAPKAVSDAADGAQAMSNLGGILDTRATLLQLAR